MTGISFIISTAGTNDTDILHLIDSIEKTNIVQYEIIIVGGLTTTVNRKNTIHIPFDETQKPAPWISKKVNLGVQASQYEIVVITRDYYIFDPDWYYEFEKFGTDWDICVQQSLACPEQGNARGNGWRGGPFPGYPEIPYAMTIPWDIDCFIPYMAIQGSFWVARRSVMIEQPMNENLLFGQADDIEWSSRVVPGWLGQKPDQNDYKIVSNPKCITRATKWKPPYPGNPDWDALERHFDPLWEKIRNGYRRPGVYHYEKDLGKVVRSPDHGQDISCKPDPSILKYTLNNQKKMKKSNFYTIGTFGDTIYSLCLMKILGGGNLYVKLNALDDFAQNVLGWKDAGPAKGRYTQQDYDMIEPLLKAQDYFDNVSLWKDEHIDYDFSDHHKFHMINGWQGNQTECYALTQGMNIHEPELRKKLLLEPWLTPVDPIRIPGKPIIINRTERHLYGAEGSGWHDFIKNGLADYGLFVGTEKEHAEFEESFKMKVAYHKTEDLLELARIIQGCEQFIGNQSSALSIAIGLGKTYWCEIRSDYEYTKTPHGGYGDTWFPRINGFYF
jgi:hypothetical protein